jgi:hypothetical protein
MQKNTWTLEQGFKDLWATGSPMQKEWEKLEVLVVAVEEIGRSMAKKASVLRTLPEIHADTTSGRVEMKLAFLETVNTLWNRVLLRTAFKVHDALDLLFHSINSANAYGCAIASRSIIEHVALLSYFVKGVPWEDGRPVQNDELIEFTKHLFTLTQGSTFDWDKFLEGRVSVRDLVKSGSWKRPHDERIPQIATLVEVLDQELAPQQGHATLRFVYSALCDVIHPSWGGDFIYAPRIYREIKPERAFDDHFKRIATLFCLPIVAVVVRFGQLGEFMLDNEPKMVAIAGKE